MVYSSIISALTAVITTNGTAGLDLDPRRDMDKTRAKAHKRTVRR